MTHFYLTYGQYPHWKYVWKLQRLNIQGSHSTWKTWKNESTPGKPGNIMEF